MSLTIWLVLGIWFALNIGFFAVRLYLTRDRVAPDRTPADVSWKTPAACDLIRLSASHRLDQATGDATHPGTRRVSRQTRAL